MNYLEKANDLQAMIAKGQFNEAIDKYYADDVTVVEASGEIRTGKEAQKQAVKDWQNNMVKQFHGAGVSSLTSNEENGVTCAESWTDCTFADGNRRKFEEVAVQKWTDGKIVHERFYYNIPGE